MDLDVDAARMSPNSRPWGSGDEILLSTGKEEALKDSVRHKRKGNGRQSSLEHENTFLQFCRLCFSEAVFRCSVSALCNITTDIWTGLWFTSVLHLVNCTPQFLKMPAAGLLRESKTCVWNRFSFWVKVTLGSGLVWSRSSPSPCRDSVQQTCWFEQPKAVWRQKNEEKCSYCWPCWPLSLWLNRYSNSFRTISRKLLRWNFYFIADLYFLS